MSLRALSVHTGCDYELIFDEKLVRRVDRMFGSPAAAQFRIDADVEGIRLAILNVAAEAPEAITDAQIRELCATYSSEIRKPWTINLLDLVESEQPVVQELLDAIVEYYGVDYFRAFERHGALTDPTGREDQEEQLRLASGQRLPPMHPDLRDMLAFIAQSSTNGDVRRGGAVGSVIRDPVTAAFEAIGSRWMFERAIEAEDLPWAMSAALLAMEIHPLGTIGLQVMELLLTMRADNQFGDLDSEAKCHYCSGTIDAVAISAVVPALRLGRWICSRHNREPDLFG
ncbi:hypothetical protein ACFFOM_10060 [Microlunatus capsulatus]|uniref:AcrR family transcriptional regulator n=1 Tax=Microlunatus capsulatus TaxID=99117 RepID=A0ABS4ZA97_9ACTN|nr:hypothetical protein [Microlunatus capsulatus]MBP2417921.1 AcrR family transcriptional regulator [Microlunatus capsulatus]